LPLIDFDCEPSEITRSGNQHRKFVPTNAYLTSDGFIYVAMGSDVQWQRFTAIPKFAGLVSDKRVTNNGRIEGRVALFKDIAEIMKNFPTAEIAADLAAATIPNSPINTIPQVLETPAVGGRATTTTTPEGKTIRMQPMAVDLEGASTEFRFSPKYGEQTDAILEEAGYSEDERGALREAGIAV
jgi:crotonobetainyl-CoA:carnitine CoA-transferase CaiB-like acyl-CoA transferase